MSLVPHKVTFEFLSGFLTSLKLELIRLRILGLSTPYLLKQYALAILLGLNAIE